MTTKQFKTCAVLFLAALALSSLCVDKKVVDPSAEKCVATGGSWKYSECSGGCVPDTKQERLDRIKNPVACDAACHKGYVCSCPSGRYWASREEGCIMNQAPGGGCSYKEFPGKCTIVNPIVVGGGLNYVFVPNGGVDVSGTFFTSPSQLNPYRGSTTSRPEAIIGTGKPYDCTLKVEVSGSCTPVIVVFTGPVCGKTYAAPLSDEQKTECAHAGGSMQPVAIPCPSTGCSQSFYACNCAKCGNGICESGETEANCPQDCNKSGAVCGNGFCEEGETASSCPQDCRPHKPICGDAFCERSLGEDEHTCPQDCVIKASCGNSMCEEGESASTCPQDCKPQEAVCGNSFCEVEENEATCPQDCLIKAVCGNGFCEQGELGHCPEDCGSTTSICGNGICESGEDHNNCPRDCYPAVDRKPVIYLYPQKPETVTVTLDFDGKVVADYPDYDSVKGWEVMAYPDGHLVNRADGREYSYLFWEGDSYGDVYDMSQGFVVKGSDTTQFLQDTLAKIGLTPREYNEFIVYWYPRMKDNPYNIVHFAGTEYTSKAKLTVTPQPDSLLRVFMVYRPSQTNVSVTAQTFKPFERKGFTVVEWGGSMTE